MPVLLKSNVPFSGLLVKARQTQKYIYPFYNTGGVLFGVKEYVPALMQYVEKYSTELHFNHQLVKVDVPAKKAWFKVVNDENAALVETDFDMLHVVPPQQAPDFIRASTLTDEAGWVSVNPQTLQHTQHANIFALGDVMNAPNAKTAAAARAQARSLRLML